MIAESIYLLVSETLQTYSIIILIVIQTINWLSGHKTRAPNVQADRLLQLARDFSEDDRGDLRAAHHPRVGRRLAEAAKNADRTEQQ